MAPLISTLLAIATSLLLLAITTAKGEIFKSAPGWLVPVLFVIAGILYIVAIVLGVIHFQRERGSKPPPQSQPPDTALAAQEKLRHETLILAFMREQHQRKPPGPRSLIHHIEGIVSATHLPTEEAREALDGLYLKSLIYRSTVDDGRHLIYWLSDPERDPPDSASTARGRVTGLRNDLQGFLKEIGERPQTERKPGMTEAEYDTAKLNEAIPWNDELTRRLKSRFATRLEAILGECEVGTTRDALAARLSKTHMQKSDIQGIIDDLTSLAKSAD
jgi:hypothetical protein